MLDSSRDDLPLSLALVQWFDEQVNYAKLKSNLFPIQ
jgi:hypothetical protein